MIHPTNLHRLVDHLGHEINVGDTVLIPVRRRTSIGGAKLVKGKIERIDPLVERPAAHWHSTGPRSRTPLYRERQINTKKATEFLDYPENPGRHSCLTVDRHGMKFSIRYNDCVKLDA